MLLATALALLITGCTQQTHCSKQTGSSSTKGNHHHQLSSFLELRQKKTVDAAKEFVAAQKMLLKQKPSKHS